MVDLSIIILTYDTKTITLNCLASIYKNVSDFKFDVWVLDNGSTDGSSAAISQKFPQVNLIKSENLGFVGGNNLVLKKVYKNSKYCLLLNSDTILEKDSIDKLLNFAGNSSYGIMTCRLLNLNGSFQPNAGDLPTLIPLFLWISELDGIFGFGPSFHQKRKNYYKNNKSIGWASGAALLIKNEVLEKIGFLDNKIYMYGEDVEYCWRAKKAGFTVGWTDEATITHIGGASSKFPKYVQWKGEFLGLIYLYRKYYDGMWAAGLKVLIYFFSFLRMVAFAFLGKFEHAKTYAKIIFTI